MNNDKYHWAAGDRGQPAADAGPITAGTYQVLEVTHDEQLIVKHEPTGKTDILPDYWLTPVSAA